MKVTTVAVDELYPIVYDAIKAHTPAYKKVIQQYIESRSKDLYDIAPFKRLPFLADDINAMFNAIKLDKKKVTECLSHTYYWDMNFNPRAAKDEFTMTVMMIIRYFIMTKDSKNAELSAIYLSFSGRFYPSIHSRKFIYPPDKYRHVMEYVVNNVLTQKFDLKREGSLFGAMRSICITWLNTYNSKFMDPDDEDVADMIQQLHGRIKSFLGNIATQYYAVYNNKNTYMAYNSDSNDDGSFRIADSDSLKAERCVENAMNWITNHGVDQSTCVKAHDSNVKTDEIRTIIESIQDNPDNLRELRTLLSIMVFECFSSSAIKDICSIRFVTFTLAAKPNSKNKNIIKQKDIIESWLDENSPQYRKRKSREATKSSYNKSVLMYYALVINQSNK